MARGIMWGFAGAAAAVLVAFVLTGWPRVRGGIAGDITQAKRYQVQQLTKKDVVLEDTAAHRFIQSDAFDRLLKDEAVRRVLNKADVRVQLIDPRVFKAVGEGRLQSVLDNPEIRDALGDPAVASALARPAFRAALASPGFRAALLDLHLAWAMAHGIRGCDDEWGCSQNSPIVSGADTTRRAFHDLHLGGQPNSAGFAVVGIRKGSIAYALDVTGSVVAARSRKGDAPALTGAALVGLVLELSDLAGLRYTLQVAGIGTTTYWVGAPDPVPTYSLTYTSATHSTPQPLCTTSVNEAILFAGDRYDAATKTVTATGTAANGWVNIACAGTALAKLHLTRHTEASQMVRTTAAERQAMLKMFTADVCGDGTPFTVHGQPLLWSDAKGVTRFTARPASIEAEWNERGAVCLDTPRRPELAAAIASRCGARLPRCSAPHPRGYVTSANP